jgi:PAS fold
MDMQRKSISSSEPHQYDPPALSLDERGMIQDCTKSFERLFGFQRRDLVWQHVSRLLPQLAGVDLIQAGRLNPFLNYLCHCGHHYQAQNRQGDSFSCSLSLVRVEFGGKRSLRMIINPSLGLDA